MKLINYILNASGFDSFSDMLGIFSPAFSTLFTLSVVTGTYLGLIELYSGISIILWIFFLFAAFFDLGLGVYANIFYLKNKYSSQRMFRGIFKAVIFMLMIFLTNTFKLGIERSEITPEYIKTAFVYASATIHYTSVMIIGLYVLLGIAENGAKVEIRFCISLVRILKIKINNIEKDDNDGTS